MPHPIHHITAIASDPRQCIDFYTQVLGLRLVKKTVNQDQTEAYHLFFGDKTGEPGMDLTFFTFPGVSQGQPGIGAVSTISFAVPNTSIDFWFNRFNDLNIKHEGIQKKYGTSTIIFYDQDNQRLELVGVNQNDLESTQVWSTSEVTHKNAIHWFNSAKLSVSSKSSIEPIITEVLGYKQIDQHQQVSLFQIEGTHRGGYLEIEEHPNDQPVFNAAGTVHHIAFQVKDRQELVKTRAEISSFGLHPTDIIDRYYFKSVYFRTTAGILFELATNGPGFTIDEAEEALGKKLSLPPFLESDRKQIEDHLQPIQ